MWELIPLIAFIMVFLAWPRITENIAQNVYQTVVKTGYKPSSRLNWAVRLTLGNVKLLVLRGHVYMKAGDYQKALRDFNRAVAKDRHNLVLRGILYTLMKDYPKALEDFESLRTYYPHMEDGYKGAVPVLITMGRSQEASEIGELFVKRFPKNSLAFFQRGCAKTCLGDIEAAIQDFTDAISIDTKMTDAYRERSILYMFSNQHELARADLESALEILPDNVSLHNSRIILNLKEGRQDQALEEANMMVEKFPQEVAAFHYRAIVYMVMGLYEQAENDIDTVEELSKDEVQNLAARGQLNLNRQNLTEAIRYYESAIALDFHKYGIMAALAIALYLSGEVAEAIRRWKQVLVYDRRFANEAWVDEYYCFFEHERQAAVQLAQAVN